MGLFSTIDVIVGSPIRSTTWKFVDVLILFLLWTATIASFLIWLDGNAFTTWSIVVRILPLITALATASSWYRHPKLSKRARQKAERRALLESTWRSEGDKPTTA